MLALEDSQTECPVFTLPFDVSDSEHFSLNAKAHLGDPMKKQTNEVKAFKFFQYVKNLSVQHAKACLSAISKSAVSFCLTL
jgi:hypothetical protein